MYVILNKNDYNNLSIIDKTYFTKIDNDILFDKYIFCNFIGEDFQFKTIVLENNIHSIVLNTYLSKSSYSELYKYSIIIDNFERKKLNYSFFEVLIASFLNLQPKFDEEYLLVAKDNPEEYIKTIIQLNEFLKINKLLLNINLVSPSLSDLFIASMNDVIQQEANSEIIIIEEVEKINNDYFNLIIAEFIIKSSKYYSKKQIRNFLLKKFSLFIEI